VSSGSDGMQCKRHVLNEDGEMNVTGEKCVIWLCKKNDE